jgi:hypothetical protein
MKILIVLFLIFSLSGCFHLGITGLMLETAKTWEIKKLKNRLTVLEKKNNHS